MSRHVWADSLAFALHHYLEHMKMDRHLGRPVECYKCGETVNLARFSEYDENAYMLARHIWSKHLHKEFRDPSLPPPAEGEQDKGKLAEASKMAQDAQATTEIQTSSSEKQGKLRAPEPADTDKPDNAEGRLCIPNSYPIHQYPRSVVNETPEERREWLSEWSQQYPDLPPLGFSLRAAPNRKNYRNTLFDSR